MLLPYFPILRYKKLLMEYLYSHALFLTDWDKKPLIPSWWKIAKLQRTIYWRKDWNSITKILNRRGMHFRILREDNSFYWEKSSLCVDTRFKTLQGSWNNTCLFFRTRGEKKQTPYCRSIINCFKILLFRTLLL